MRTSLVCTLAAGSAMAASASSGVVSGQVADDQGRPVGGATLILSNPVSGYRQRVRSDAKGGFTFQNVPFNTYHLDTRAAGLLPGHLDVDVHSQLPLVVAVALKPEGAVVAVEENLRLVEDHPSTHLDIDKSAIERTPAAVQSRAMESILLATPGFIADENGRFHFRGSHGQMTYVVDGIPVSDQMHATFSNSMDPSQVESMEVITGGISAEYGGKPVVVVNLTTKSGLGAANGFEGEASFGAARFQTFEAGFNARGGSASFGWFVSGAASESDRFLDPVNFENLHNHGKTGRAFSRFDWILGSADTLRFSVSGGRTDRQVANLTSQQAQGQDQRASTSDANASLAWTHLFSAAQSLDASLFYRTSRAELKPTTALAEGFTDSGHPDFPYWARQDRSLDNLGLMASFTQRWGKENLLKVGVQHIAFPLQERFDFAITDDTVFPDPTDRMHPYTPSGGGHIFHFDAGLRPTLTSAFVQNDIHLGAFFLALGLRHDAYTVAEISDNQLQPRIGLSYRVDATGTVLRASYDRLMILREHENLALSLSQQAWDLGPQAGTPRQPLRPEHQDSFSYGVEQQLGRAGRVMVEYWEKHSRNAGDNAQFLNTGVLFPVGADRGLFRGMNLRVDLVPVNGWSGYASLGKTRAIFQAPLVGGLQLEAPEAAPGERFLIDHDQKLSVQVGIAYEHEGFTAQVIGRYDSGLVASDPGEVRGNPDYAFGAAYVHQDSEGTWRIKPRTTWDLSLSQAWKLATGKRLTVGVDLLNATDEKGLYNFLSTFGGTHVIPPRTLAARVKWTF
ncbi:TonB-dependent receptor [Geothrix sp. PMB-07]|uniref:TonB-dependent receptor n=1 Tax=Geothrix sp. PMB-07 TaxID=3068640 RepID=UPI0027419C2D|nr:TonB-dependent receptor [Geothrix sp. PMB-07]WLT30532.1 TonB-dependent receptor [Geothrix sp. PMB-07]